MLRLNNADFSDCLILIESQAAGKQQATTMAIEQDIAKRLEEHSANVGLDSVQGRKPCCSAQD